MCTSLLISVTGCSIRTAKLGLSYYHANFDGITICRFRQEMYITKWHINKKTDTLLTHRAWHTVGGRCHLMPGTSLPRMLTVPSAPPDILCFIIRKNNNEYYIVLTEWRYATAVISYIHVHNTINANLLKMPNKRKFCITQYPAVQYPISFSCNQKLN